MYEHKKIIHGVECTLIKLENTIEWLFMISQLGENFQKGTYTTEISGRAHNIRNNL